MASSAEDLLKSKSITELRSLIQQLHNDAEGKKTELRSMVGSQYHEFIQSADKIAEMYKHSKSLVQSLDGFWTKNQAFASQVHSFISQDKQAAQTLLTHSSQEFQFQDINCSNVWKDLGDCDVYSAVRRILIAVVTLKTKQPEDEFLLRFNTESVDDLLSPHVKDSLRAFTLSASSLSDLKSCLLLTETVIDDAVVLSGDRTSNASLDEHARTYAALAVMSPLELVPSHQPMHGGVDHRDLLGLFLHHAGSQLDELFDQYFVDSASADILDRGVLKLIEHLQHLLRDVYALFFAPHSHHSSASNVTVHGLVKHYSVQLQRDVTTHLDKSSTSIASNGHANGRTNVISSSNSAFPQEEVQRVKKWLQSQWRKVTDRTSSVLASLTSAAQVSRLQQQVYAACLSPTLLSSSKQQQSSGATEMWVAACRLLLGKPTTDLTPSLQVQSPLPITDDELQDLNLLLWTRVFRVSFLHQVERLLHRACEDIFANAQLQLFAVLLDYGLRVEVKVQAPSEDDDMDAVPHVELSVHAVAESTSTDDHHLQGMLRDRLLTQTLSSVQIYTQADSIRQRLDRQIVQLLEEVITPVQRAEQKTKLNNGSAASSNTLGGGGLSGHALMDALQANCSRLLGQWASLLRQLSEHCRVLLQRDHGMCLGQVFGIPVATSTRSTDKHKQSSTSSLSSDPMVSLAFRHLLQTSSASSNTNTNNKNSNKSMSVVGQLVRESALAGLLVLGRVAWLMRVHEQSSRTFASVLAPAATNNNTAVHSLASASSSAIQLSLNSMSVAASSRMSEEQCRSAFEISDTVGDGVIRRTEALDALRALCAGGEQERTVLALFMRQESTSSSTSSSAALVSLSDLNSLTYDEFLLVCGPALRVSAQELYSQRRLEHTLEHVIALAHSVLLSAIVSGHARMYTSALTKELLGAQFRMQWQKQSMEDQDDSSEQMQAPSHVSRALHVFISSVSWTVSRVLVSADTLLHALPCSTKSVDGSDMLIPSAVNVDDADDNDNDDDDDQLGKQLMKVLSRDGSRTLHQFIMSWTQNLSLAVIARVATTVATEVVLPPAASVFYSCLAEKAAEECQYTPLSRSEQEKLLEDVQLQLWMDVRVLKWLMNAASKSSSSTYFDAVERSVADLVDPVTLELVQHILVARVIPQVAEQTRLLFVLGESSTLVRPKSAADSELSPTYVGVSVDSGAADQLLQGLFATDAVGSTTPKSASGASGAVPRLTLLPMALPSTMMSSSSSGQASTAASAAAAAAAKSVPITPVAKGKPASSNTATASVVKWW